MERPDHPNFQNIEKYYVKYERGIKNGKYGEFTIRVSNDDITGEEITSTKFTEIKGDE